MTIEYAGSRLELAPILEAVFVGVGLIVLAWLALRIMLAGVQMIHWAFLKKSAPKAR